MNPFPEEWELLSLFEVEPTLLDRDVPWFYNELTFETTRGEDRIQCQIEPGYQILRIRWWQNSDLKVTLDLHWVKGLRIETGKGRDYLVASFRDSHLLDFEFHLKPTIQMNWGTASQCP